MQVFSLSEQRLVVLEISVTNAPSDPLHPEEDGDDAHAAQLIISLPNTLSYAGSRIPPQVGLNNERKKKCCRFFHRVGGEKLFGSWFLLREFV